MSIIAPPREKVIVRECDDNVVDRLEQELAVAKPIASILAARNLTDYQACKKYFRPEMDHFHDPFIFVDMEKSVNRILVAIDNREKIVVYGDYDVDGVTSTVLLVSIIKRLGGNCDYYLPNRLTEGYGISIGGIDDIVDNNCRLIITVDCGISAYKAVDHAKTKGVDIIITDHHEAQEILPDAFAVINPKVAHCPYPYKYLAGVGVALKIAHALSIKSGNKTLWHEYLDFAALGTAADIVPLTGENRLIAYFGFKQMSKTKNVGLQTLITLKKLTGKLFNTANVVFQIAPCINAAGRLGDSCRGVKLFLAEDVAEAQLYANELISLNYERQALDRTVQERAVRWVQEHADLENDYALVAGDRSWHVGVIGISASKIVDMFYRPTFLFSIGDDGFARGSARSIRGLNLMDALNECGDLLETYGGHAMAAGASIRAERIPEFRLKFNEAVKKRLVASDLIPQVFADVEVAIPQLTPKFFRILKQMEPFGPGNMRPVLFCRNVNNHCKPRIVGKNHLKMAVISDGQVMDAIAFNFGNRIGDISAAESYSLAFSLDENEWNGKVNLQMKVKGIVS